MKVSLPPSSASPSGFASFFFAPFLLLFFGIAAAPAAAAATPQAGAVSPASGAGVVRRVDLLGHLCPSLRSRGKSLHHKLSEALELPQHFRSSARGLPL
jgi:hypothetical protein